MEEYLDVSWKRVIEVAFTETVGKLIKPLYRIAARKNARRGLQSLLRDYGEVNINSHTLDIGDFACCAIAQTMDMAYEHAVAELDWSRKECSKNGVIVPRNTPFWIQATLYDVLTEEWIEAYNEYLAEKPSIDEQLIEYFRDNPEPEQAAAQAAVSLCLIDDHGLLLYNGFRPKGGLHASI